MFLQNGEGGAGVLDIGQIQQTGDEGDGLAQINVGAGKDLGKLVDQDQRDSKDGIQPKISLSK